MATSEELKRQILEQKLEGNNENESNNESENESGGLGRIIDEPIVEKEEEEKEEVEENNTKVKVNKLDKFKTIEEQANAYVEAEKKISSQGKEVGELREQVKEMEELLKVVDAQLKEEKDNLDEDETGEGNNSTKELIMVKKRLKDLEDKAKLKVKIAKAVSDLRAKYDDYDTYTAEEIETVKELGGKNPLEIYILAAKGLRKNKEQGSISSKEKAQKSVDSIISKTRATVEKPSSGGDIGSEGAPKDINKMDAKQLKGYLKKELGIKEIEHY